MPKKQPEVVYFRTGKAIRRRSPRQARRFRRDDFDLLPIPVREQEFRYCIDEASKLGVTHLLASPFGGTSATKRRGSEQFALVPIANLLDESSPPTRCPVHNAGGLRYDLVYLDPTGIMVPPDEDLWTPWRQGVAKWRCPEGDAYTSSFEASPDLWNLFGHPPLADDDDGFPPEFLDILFCSLGDPKQDWAPELTGYKGPFPFTTCFQFQSALGSHRRWAASIIHKIENWHVGFVTDITPELTRRKKRISFEVPETKERHVSSAARPFRPGVFVWLGW